MEGESTSSRSGAAANDYFIFGRVRTLEEIAAAIDQVTTDRVNEFLAANVPRDWTVVVVGPKDLQTPV